MGITYYRNNFILMTLSMTMNPDNLQQIITLEYYFLLHIINVIRR